MLPSEYSGNFGPLNFVQLVERKHHQEYELHQYLKKTAKQIIQTKKLNTKFIKLHIVGNRMQPFF